MPRLPRIHRLLTVGLTLGLVLAMSVPALASPPATPDFGKSIDPYARYEGQTRCLSTEAPGVRDFRAMVQKAWGANGGGILRSCSSGGKSEHKEGRAYDWMLDANSSKDRAVAKEFLDWLLATDEYGNKHAMARRLGVMYVIWNRQTWSAYRPDAGWSSYTGANPHTDHIHISFSWDGAKGLTSFWNTLELTAEPGPFIDVPATHRFVNEITWLTDEGLITGRADGRFLPERAITRGQVASLLWRIMGEPTEGSDPGFDDVPNDAHYAQAVRWLTANGIARGIDDDNFGPHRPVSRGQFAVMLHALAEYPQAPAHGFRDVPAGHHFDAAVSWLSHTGVTQGTTATTFGGHDPVSRGQMSVMLERVVIDEVVPAGS